MDDSDCTVGLVCANCGDVVFVPAELLGDTDPSDIDFLCESCSPDEDV